MKSKQMKSANIFVLALLLELFVSSSYAQYSLVGNAVKINPTTYRITQDSMWQNGSVWNTTQIDLSKSFDLFFELYFGSHDDGADGMSFTLQRQGTNAGGPGGGLGASGITPSLIVEYDTYQNVDYTDPVFDHIAIERDGVADHTLPAFHLAGPVQTSSTSADIEDGTWHNTRVRWDATSKTISVYFDCVLRLTFSNDIVSTIFAGNPMVYYGFTAATGGATNEQSIRGFHFGSVQKMDTAICKGDTIQVDLSGDPSYNWVPATDISSTTSPKPFLYPSVSTQYISTVSNCYLSWNDTINITVNALPTPSVSNKAICIGDPAATFDGGAGYSAYQWSANGTGTAHTSIGTNPGNYTVQVTDGNGCEASATGVLTVNALPIVTFSLADDQMCINEAAQAITVVNPAGGTFSGAGVSGSNYNPALTTAGTHTITYTYTDGNSCKNTASDDMTVNALPILIFSLTDDQMCIDEAPQVIANANPTGGTFSGAGVNGINYDPSLTTAGIHTITYSYTDGNNCTNTATDDMTVNALPVLSFILADDQSCINGAAQAITVVTPTGGTFSGAGVSGNNYNPSLTIIGTHTITYDYTDGNGCHNSITDDMTVNDLPAVTFALVDDQMCINEAAQAITVVNPAGGVFLGAGVSGSNYNPSSTTAGTHNINYTYTDGNGCANTATDDMTVNALPVIVVADKAICAGTSSTFNAGPGFVSYAWSGLGSGNAQSTTASIAGKYTITVTDAMGCSASDDAMLTLNSIPKPDLGNDTSICQGQNVVLNPKTSALLNYVWTPNSAQSSTLTVSTSGKYKVTVSDGIGCKGSDSVFVQILSLPLVDLGNDFTICDNDYDKATITAKYSGNKQLLWSTLENNVDSILITHPGSYWVQITDSNQCSITDTIEVTPYCSDFILDWPNVITPNGDGKNDGFQAKNIDDSNFQKIAANITVISFSVYDRWGILLYYTEQNTLPYWDGRYNGAPSAAGTYYYIVKYSTSSGKNYEVPGYMTLL
jgi:gliding motility-associated-like protein